MHESQLEILKELITIGAGKAAKSLNHLLDSHIDLDVPVIRYLYRADVHKIYEDISGWGFDDLAIIKMQVNGELSGNAQLVFSWDSAEKLAHGLIEEEEGQDQKIKVEGALKEVGNILINSLIGTLGNLLGVHLAYTLPDLRKENIGRLVIVENDVSVIFCLVKFFIQTMDIGGNFILCFEIDRLESFRQLIVEYVEKHN